MFRLQRIAVALMEEEKLSHGGIAPPQEPPDDDGGDDWDPEDFFDKNWAAILNWASTSPYARKIRTFCYENLYGKTPQVNLKFKGGRYEGNVRVRIFWREPWGSVEKEALGILRNSDLWKHLRIQHHQVWRLTEDEEILNSILQLCFEVDRKRPKTSMGSLERDPASKRVFFEATSWIKNNEPKIEKQIWSKLTSYGVNPKITELHKNNWNDIHSVFLYNSPSPDALMGNMDIFYFWETDPKFRTQK